MSAFGTTSDSLVYSRDEHKVPLTHTAYLRKRGQSIKHWKRRYAVVELGRMTYFEKHSDSNEPPYGVGLKGSLPLWDCEIEDGPTDSMFMLTIKAKNREMLVEAENGKDEALSWRALFEHHIQFCKENPDLFLQVDASFEEDEAKRAAVAAKCRAVSRDSAPRFSLENVDDDGDEEEDKDGTDDQQRRSFRFSAPEAVQLSPCFVIKTKLVQGPRKDRQKLFINVCEHDSIPVTDKKRSNKRWPVMVMGSSLVSTVDKGADECHVLDVCVHPSVIKECREDASGEAQDCLTTRIMVALMAREKKNDANFFIDKDDYTFPRLANRYKGDVVPSFLIPRNIRDKSRSSSVFSAISTADLVHLDEEESEEEESRDTAADLPSNTIEAEKSITKKERKFQLLRDTSAFFTTGTPKTYITVNVERKVGAVIRESPHKSAAVVQNLPRHARTYCYGARKIDKNNDAVKWNEEGICWYRVKEGWTRALTDGRARLLRPMCSEQPIGSAITGVNLIECEEKGFFSVSTKLKFTYSVQLTFPQDALLRLQRSLKDFTDLRDGLVDDGALIARKGNTPVWNPTVGFPEHSYNDIHDEEDIEVEVLLEMMKDLDQWLNCVFKEVAFNSVPAIRAFLQCTDIDCAKMDLDLSADGGLDGAWPHDYM